MSTFPATSLKHLRMSPAISQGALTFELELHRGLVVQPWAQRVLTTPWFTIHQQVAVLAPFAFCGSGAVGLDLR